MPDNSFIPEGSHEITPYLFIKGAAEAIKFYKSVFDAEELMRLTMPDGRVAYAAIKIGNSRLMLADEFPEMNVKGPLSLGASPVTIHLYVQNVDACINNAVDAGAKILKPIEDQFFGDRSGSIVDPFGHVWNIATHKEDISNEEIHQRFKKIF